MHFRHFGRLLFRLVFVAALAIQGGILLGQTVEQGSAADEAAKRLDWLKSRVGSNALPQATPVVVKAHFAGVRAPGLRPLEAPLVDTGSARSQPVGNPAGDTHPTVSRVAEAHTPEPHPKTTHSSENPTTDTHPTAPRVAEANTPEPQPTIILHSTGSPTADTHPAAPRVVEVHPPEPHPKTTHSAETSIVDTHLTAPPIAQGPPADRRPPDARHTESVAAETRITEIHPVEVHAPSPPSSSYGPTSRAAMVSNRYPWKTGIVTTIFWIGEPVGGHNFTPNYASSWDSNWTRAYGGYDNPNPDLRRNFIPVNFTPRQNPFYVALPYNDVTRGTTKPEARVVIPWFKEAFRKEGQSVCRDRWVAIRNRAGRVAYAQWSDCGPFRTDHWQYVFGMEKPKPNLNQGAGLDVSPALRDYLGLQSTDVTDWKFVEARDVPNGPWTLYGENNTFGQKVARFP